MIEQGVPEFKHEHKFQFQYVNIRDCFLYKCEFCEKRIEASKEEHEMVQKGKKEIACNLPASE